MNAVRQEAVVLAVNAGSSSLKLGAYRRGHEHAVVAGAIEGLQPGGTPVIRLRGREPEPLPLSGDGGGQGVFEAALARLAQLLSAGPQPLALAAIAHRIVHGGERHVQAVRVDDAVLAELDALCPLAPLHQPHNLQGVRAMQRAFPGVPQIACFDTAFHATLPEVERRFALPPVTALHGVRRYGFHGLSYQYLAQVLQARSARWPGRAVLAHLGNGASACAVKDGRSVATSMGFSALDGLVMGTRSGSVDAGVLLHLMRQGWDVDALEDLLYRRAGLLGVSGLSADMRTLRASSEPGARLAIEVFTHRLVRECGGLAALLGGLDLLAFTGGIGEHDAGLRADACTRLAHLGVRLDERANQAAVGDEVRAIHAEHSAVEVWVVPTDEGRVAASEAWRLLDAAPRDAILR